MKLDKYPPGLLEALNLKQNGIMPWMFGDSISGVIEAFDFYASDRLASSQSPNATVTAFNATLTDTIVTSQLVRSMGFTIVEGAAAGTFLHFALGFQIPQGNATCYIASGSFGAIAAGASRWFGVPLPRPVFVPAGSVIIGSFTSDAAGADHSLRLNRLVTTLG